MDVSRFLKGAACGACVAVGLVASAWAQAPTTAPDPKFYIRPNVLEDMREFLEQPVINLSVEAQNARRGDLTEQDIEALDQQWRAETEAEDQPLIAATLTSPASAYLTQVQAQAGGLYVALFVMDRYGLNVGQSVATADYWQGDEAKFLSTFPKGAGAVFIDEPEFNDDFKAWVVQVNMTLVNDGTPIGSATVEVNLDELRRRAMLSQ